MIKKRIKMIENKKAFTLAEVLITLGVIGVVAALTLPALISKYEEVVMVNKLKRTYSELANAIEMRKAELGTSDYAEQFNPKYTAAEQLDGFIKYLNVIERCSSSSNGCGGKNKVILPQSKTNDGFGNIKQSEIDAKERAVLNDGTIVYMANKNYSGDCMVTYMSYDRDENGNYTNLEDGKPVPKPYQAQQCAEIFFDINGAKGRNQFGYDCYSFAITPDKVNQHTGYGGIYNTMRTGKLTYEKYSPNGKFK